jgi:hypothetical protein
MRTRLFLAALCMLLLPLCFGQSNSTSPQFSVYASGYYVRSGTDELVPCECDEPGCSGGDCATASPEGDTSSDLGSEGLFALAALLLWLRLKP